MIYLASQLIQCVDSTLYTTLHGVETCTILLPDRLGVIRRHISALCIAHEVADAIIKVHSLSVHSRLRK